MCGLKVITKSFQTPPSNRPKRHSEISSGDEETDHHPTSLPAQRVTPSGKTDVVSTSSEPIKLPSKKTAGSVSFIIFHT